MGDLSDDELMAMQSSGAPYIDRDQRVARAIAEIRRHRAAQTASAERVRPVVRAVVADWLAMNCSPTSTLAEVQVAGVVMGSAIADRVAAQLAGDAPTPAVAVTTSLGRVRESVREYAIRIIGGYLGAGLSSATTEAVAYAIAGHVVEQLTAHAGAPGIDAGICRELAAWARNLAHTPASDGEHVDLRVRMSAVAGQLDAAAQLTAPTPGHVCPVPYGLGPEDVDEIEAARNFVERHGGFQSTVDVLGKILAAHRAPAPTIEPLPEVIACGTEGCVSSIKKHLLPAGWLLLDGTWRCPRCKVIATSEAS